MNKYKTMILSGLILLLLASTQKVCAKGNRDSALANLLNDSYTISTDLYSESNLTLTLNIVDRHPVAGTGAVIYSITGYPTGEVLKRAAGEVFINTFNFVLPVPRFVPELNATLVDSWYCNIKTPLRISPRSTSLYGVCSIIDLDQNSELYNFLGTISLTPR